MTDITKRQKNIIRFLLNDEKYVTVASIAEKFNVSSRTIRNDLAMMETFLRESGCWLQSKTNNGVKIILNDNYGKLIQRLHCVGNEEFDYQDRFFYTLLYCLINNEFTYGSLAEKLRISKQTVISHFSAVVDVLESNDINVIKTAGKGITLSGKESSIRNCFRSTLFSPSLNQAVLDKIKQQENLSTFNELATLITSELKCDKGIKFSQEEKTTLLIEFVIYRVKKGYHSENRKHLLKFVNSTIYEYLKDKEELNDLDDNDVLFLTGVIISDGMFDSSTNAIASLQDKEDANSLTEYLLKKLLQIRSIDLIEKKEFVEGLKTHLSSAISRLRSGIKVNNELLEQIKYRIPLMYEFTKKQLLKCEGQYGLEFNENEIAYIAIYLTSAFEDSLREEFNFKVLLVCSFGVTTSAILRSRIIQNIPEYNVIGPLNIKEAKEYLKENKVDLIVSTVDFHYDDIKTIVVGALLSIDDISSIKEYLLQASYDDMCSKFLNSYKEIKEPTVQYISDTVKEDKIKIVDHIDDWKQAISLASEPLIKDGSLEPRYVEAMIEAVIEFGTYMVLVPEVAFVHAGLDNGINRECSSILISKTPFSFGEKNCKMIRAIVVMGIKDKNSTALLSNVYILEDSNNQKLLKDENLTVEDVLNMHA